MRHALDRNGGENLRISEQVALLSAGVNNTSFRLKHQIDGLSTTTITAINIERTLDSSSLTDQIFRSKHKNELNDINVKQSLDHKNVSLLTVPHVMSSMSANNSLNKVSVKGYLSVDTNDARPIKVAGMETTNDHKMIAIDALDNVEITDLSSNIDEHRIEVNYTDMNTLEDRGVVTKTHLVGRIPPV